MGCTNACLKHIERSKSLCGNGQFVYHCSDLRRLWNKLFRWRTHVYMTPMYQKKLRSLFRAQISQKRFQKADNSRSSCDPHCSHLLVKTGHMTITQLGYSLVLVMWALPTNQHLSFQAGIWQYFLFSVNRSLSL